MRPAKQDDSAILYEHVSIDESVMEHVLGSGAMSRIEAEEFLRNRFARDESTLGMCTLLSKQIDQIVGMTGILACAALGGDSDREPTFVLALVQGGIVAPTRSGALAVMVILAAAAFVTSMAGWFVVARLSGAARSVSPICWVGVIV